MKFSRAIMIAFYFMVMFLVWFALSFSDIDTSFKFMGSLTIAFIWAWANEGD